MSKGTKPKRHTTYYYDYMQEVVPWLEKQLSKSDKSFVGKELWDAIQESTEGTHDATAYLDFETLESYLEDCSKEACASKVMALLRTLADEKDSDGIEVDISW